MLHSRNLTWKEVFSKDTGVAYLLSIGTLWKRELVRFFRQRSRIFGALGTPLIFWLFLGSGLGDSFRAPASGGEMNYLEFFFPGTILMVILFTTIFSSFSIIEDRKEGFLLSVLVAPVPRSAIVLGKILGSATLAAIQGMLLLLASPLVGIPITLLQFVAAGAVLFLISLCLSSLGFLTAWKSESTQGFHSIMNTLLIPMWLLSGAIFPLEGAFPWIKWIMQVNPLTYSLIAIRKILYDQNLSITSSSLNNSLLITIGFGITLFCISLWVVRHGKVRGLE